MPKPAERKTENSLDVLEWPRLQDHLRQRCWTPYGHALWEAAPFMESIPEIEAHRDSVCALKLLLFRYGDPVMEPGGIEDITTSLERLDKGGEVNARELGQILGTLNRGRQYLGHFHKSWKKENRDPALLPVFEDYSAPVELIETLRTIVDPAGNVLDSASESLGQLRARLRRERESIREKLNRILRENAKALQEPIITEREGRFVLPVRVDQKSTIPGVVHAGSSSGATVFVEPHSVVEMNNALQTTQGQIRNEIGEILKATSRKLEEELPVIREFLDRLGWLDRRAAAARLSKDIDAEPAEIIEGPPAFELKQARHPLLIFQQKAGELDDVVPNDVHLGQDDQRTLVITGPNTGGKTVLLKTLGLCALMLRAGLHLPVGEGSAISVLNPVLADIGDQQSIAQNLSTFSAHLENLKRFISVKSEQTLVLIDEIAAGTDPAEGAALARAVLEELHERGGLTIVTTHLGALKTEAHQHPGYVNASVEFDPENLRPTYRLILGVPGTSNAITIAQRLGIADTIINKARGFLSRPHRESAELIEELEYKNRKLAEELHKAEAFRKSSEKTYERVEFERQQLESEKRQSLRQFRTGMKDRIRQLEAEIKHLKKELRQAANVDQVDARLRELDRKSSQVFEDAYQQMQAEAPKLNADDLKEGQEVRSRRWNVKGEIQAISGDDVTIQAGHFKFTTDVADLELPNKFERKAKKRKKQNNIFSSSRTAKGIVEKTENIGVECNVLGLRTDDALSRVQEFLDKAALAGHARVDIIHGHGTGALKKAIREYLKDSPYAKRFHPGDPKEGGDGKTVVEL